MWVCPLGKIGWPFREYVFDSSLQLDKGNRNVGILEIIRVCGNLALHHGDLVAIGQFRAVDAVLVNFVRQHVPSGDFEAHARKELRRSSE